MRTARFLKREEINDQEWDKLINQSPNSLPYALSWYLDAVAENWGALIFGDYEAGMPLVWLRKWGVKCLYQPYFCQQLGFFASKEIDRQEFHECFIYIKRNFPYVDINLNPSAAAVEDEFTLKKKRNLLLVLNTDYQQLKKKFSENHKRNISKAVKSELEYSGSIDAKLFTEFYIRQIQERQSTFKSKHAALFRKLANKAIGNRSGKIIGAMNREGVFVSSALLITHKDRMINIAHATSESGRNIGAAHFLFSRCIEQYAKSNKILDFEGSSVPSIARFYEGFGAQPETFFQYKTNLLKGSFKRFE